MLLSQLYGEDMLKDLYEEAMRSAEFSGFNIRLMLWAILIVDVLTLVAVLK